MGIGIIICGLNGSGKSTLGKALAEKLDFHFVDNEDLYFPKTDPDYVYSSPRTREEAEKLLSGQSPNLDKPKPKFCHFAHEIICKCLRNPP